MNALHVLIGMWGWDRGDTAQCLLADKGMVHCRWQLTEPVSDCSEQVYA